MLPFPFPNFLIEQRLDKASKEKIEKEDENETY